MTSSGICLACESGERVATPAATVAKLKQAYMML